MNNRTTANEITKISTLAKLNAETEQTKLEILFENRNALAILHQAETETFRNTCGELATTLAQVAAFKTLKYLAFKSATVSTETDAEQKKTFGYDMSIKLLRTLYADIKLFEYLHNDFYSDEIVTDAYDLIQEAITALLPYFLKSIIIDKETILETKVLKNGNEKNYNAFSIACKSIRAYITSHQQTRQFQKLAYVLGYTDTGTEILTTKRPKNDISDINEKQKSTFLKKYNLTTLQESIMLEYINKTPPAEIMLKLGIKRTCYFDNLKLAKERISATDKRVIPPKSSFNTYRKEWYDYSEEIQDNLI